MSRSRLIWRQLELPAVIAPNLARAVLVGLAALPNQPRLVLEAVGRGGRIVWRLGADDDVALRKAAHVIRTHLPDTQITPVTDEFDRADGLTAAAQLRMSGARHLPLAERDTASVTRSLLAALAQAGKKEQLRLQIVLGARTWPRTAPQRDDVRRPVLEAKHSQHGFGCAIRIAAHSGSEARARQLVNLAAAALRGLETPGVAITLGRVGIRTVASVSSPFCWPLWLSVDDLIPLTAWPVSDDRNVELPGLPPRHPKLLPVTTAHPEAGVSVGLSTVSLNRGISRPVAQAPVDALQHRHVLGPTGVGKSTLLGRLILQDVDAGRGVVVIDPKTDLVNDLLTRIPKHRLDDVVVLDPASKRPVGINPLQHTDPDLAADSIVAVFHSLFGAGLGPRSTDILHAAVLTLARRGDASLVMVPLLLTNPGFRRSVIGSVAKADPLGLGAFWAGFENLSTAERQHVIQPLLNKLRQVLLRPSLRAIFGQRTPAFSLAEIFTKQKILLVKLGKDSIGPEAAALLGSLVVSQLWQTALSTRTRQPADQRDPVMVYIDEVQDYLRLPASLADALAQARGLGMGITAAHQHRGQLGKLLEDIDANTGTKLCFRLSSNDARDVAAAFGSGQLERDDFMALDQYEAYARLLSQGTTTPWVSISTEPWPEPLRDAATLQTRADARYGQTLDAIEADLLSLTDARTPLQATPPSPDDASGPSPASRTDLGRRRTHRKEGSDDEQ